MTQNGNGKATHAVRRFWVAGASGFLGSHLVRAITAHGDQTTAVSKSGGHVAGTPIAALDILDEAAVAESARGCDGAFLCTGKVTRDREASEELYRLHVLGTRSP